MPIWHITSYSLTHLEIFYSDCELFVFFLLRITMSGSIPEHVDISYDIIKLALFIEIAHILGTHIFLWAMNKRDYLFLSA